MDSWGGNGPWRRNYRCMTLSWNQRRRLSHIGSCNLQCYCSSVHFRTHQGSCTHSDLWKSDDSCEKKPYDLLWPLWPQKEQEEKLTNTGVPVEMRDEPNWAFTPVGPRYITTGVLTHLIIFALVHVHALTAGISYIALFTPTAEASGNVVACSFGPTAHWVQCTLVHIWWERTGSG